MDKRFTVEEANALLPQIRRELADLQTLANRFEQGRRDLERTKRVEGDEAHDRFFEQEGRLEFMRMELEMMIGNFERKGVLLKMIEPGLIDFPAIVDGRDVLICWREGEERATHYHGWHDGFAGRRPLPGL